MRDVEHRDTSRQVDSLMRVLFLFAMWLTDKILVKISSSMLYSFFGGNTIIVVAELSDYVEKRHRLNNRNRGYHFRACRKLSFVIDTRKDEIAGVKIMRWTIVQ